MFIVDEAHFIATWLEGFLYGKTCALLAACIPAKEVQLFPGLGLYSGLFAMYLQCPSKRSGTALILFYSVCLLYVLSATTFVGDLLKLMLEVSNNYIYNKTIFLICRADASRDTITSTSV